MDTACPRSYRTGRPTVSPNDTTSSTSVSLFNVDTDRVTPGGGGELRDARSGTGQPSVPRHSAGGLPKRLSNRSVNAVSEAFHSVLKVEYVHRHPFRTRTEAQIRIATWITDFYNTRRLHSVCGFKSPIGYENGSWASLTVGLAA
ncbi:integrase core domain-containing protein [Streptomyces flaveolus]|uniref:integrase core domain-containing protein n=1 Tax=Streptomyces flaveolus TaxID=67297 RepID=UPI0033FAEBF6